MVKIAICFGSACHLRGAYGVVNEFKELLAKYHVEGMVEIMGEFCQAHCTEGVVVKIDDEIITHVSQQNAAEIFKQKVLERILCK
ncbi:MAG: NAD(P)H-dependent oxidoreductase subunit E [Veillonellales bacterium]